MPQGVTQLVEGEPLVFELNSPLDKAYVQVDYYSLDGGVVHMLPSPRIRNNWVEADHVTILGDLGEWIVAAPFGTELVTVLVTPRNLFKTRRTEIENRTDYLRAVQQQLVHIGRQYGKNKIFSDFLLVKTKKKNAP
jgi:hypothetical protein